MEVKILQTTKEFYKVLVSVSPFSAANPRKEGVKNSAVVYYMRDVLGCDDAARAFSDVHVHNVAGALEGEYTVHRVSPPPAKVVDIPKKVATVNKRVASNLKKSAVANKEE